MGLPGLDLSGRVAVVTGGNGGIGFGIADALMAAGADVCVWGTNLEKNERAEKELSRHDGKARALRCDVADETDVERAFAETVSLFGRVDSCFANAGVSGIGTPFTDMTSVEWRRVMAVNLDGTFHTLRAAARHMTARDGGGSLVAISSLAALEGQVRGQHYGASKAAILGLIRGLAVELAPRGIRANAVLPGWVETALAEPLLRLDRFRDRTLPRIPAGRWGRPEDLGGIAVYLAGDASAWHTGDVIVIDGGFSVA